MNHQKILIIAFLLAYILSGCKTNHIEYDATDVSDLSLSQNDFQEPISENFKFIVYGHGYGSGLDPDEYPSVNLRDNLDHLLSMKPAFFISLGDMVEESNEQQFDDLDQLLISRIDVPVFNAVGNHDIKDRALYSSRYGETFYSFHYANAIIFILDTEIEDYFIQNDQLNMLENGIASALADKSIDTIYIMMHKVLYMNYYLMDHNDSNMVRMNDLEKFQGTNFDIIVDQLLVPAARKKPIHIFAGDVGAFNGNLSPYYEKDRRANLYMYASGLGDVEDDVVLIVSNDGKNVSIQPYLLTRRETLKIEDYDQDYWVYYGIDRFEKIRPMMDQAFACAIDTCRFAKENLHMQCRYFMILIVGIIAGVIMVLFYGIRSHQRKRKIENKQ
ncbi:MAG: metallophosphoesterase [Anaerolineaceae bacterium]|nr:metallophosphoesterase [Anaerolineaceae bacterium]